MLTRPVHARADAGRMARLLDTLDSLRRGEVISVTQQRKLGLSPSAYGLDAPRARVAINDGQTTSSWLIGRDAPLGGKLYTQNEADGAIIATETNLLAALPTKAEELRDRHLFHGAPEQAIRIEIQNANGLIQLVRTDVGAWRLQQPVAGRADTRAVHRLLDRAMDLQAAAFGPDAPASLAAYGLDEPDGRIVITFDGPGEPQTLLLGSDSDPERQKIGARLQSASSIFELTRQDLHPFNSVQASDLRDRRLFPWLPREVSSIRLCEGETEVELCQTNSQAWRMTAPKPAAADSVRVLERLDRWLLARIAAFHDAPFDLAGFGLDPPARRLTIARRGLPPPGADGDGNTAMTLWIGSSPKGADHVAVKLAHEPDVYEIDASALAGFSVHPLDWRDPKVWRVEEFDVTRVTLRSGDREAHFEMDAEGRFISTDPSQQPAPQDALYDLLHMIGRLRALRFVTAEPAPLATYGLDAPQQVLTLGLRGKPEIIRSLMLGRTTETGDGVFAMIQGQDEVFVVSPAVREILEHCLSAVATPAPKGLREEIPDRS